jgi:hypothetical protein
LKTRGVNVTVGKAELYLVSLPHMPQCPVYLVPLAFNGSGVVGGPEHPIIDLWAENFLGEEERSPSGVFKQLKLPPAIDWKVTAQ